MKVFIFILLTSATFQAHAENGDSGQELSEKRRLEKLEKGVCELGAERERERAAKQGAQINTQSDRNICDGIDGTKLDLLEKRRLEKFENAVLELGINRERERSEKQEANQEVKIQRY